MDDGEGDDDQELEELVPDVPLHVPSDTLTDVVVQDVVLFDFHHVDLGGEMSTCNFYLRTFIRV